MAEMTGYARYGLNSRSKCCKHCGEEFVLNILIQTSVAGLEYQDMYDTAQKEKLKRVTKMMNDFRTIQECAEIVGELAAMMFREKGL